MPRRRIFASLLRSAVVLLLGGVTRAATIDSATLEQSLGNPAQWLSPEFISLWPRDGAEAGAPVSHARLAAPPLVFGIKPDAVSATFAGDDIHSISVVLLDAGKFFGFENSNLPAGEIFEKGKIRFDEDFNARRTQVLDALKKTGGSLSVETSLSPRGGLKLKAGIIRCGNGVARLLAYEHQLLMLSFHRNEAEARSILANPAVASRKSAARLSPLDSFAQRSAEVSPERRIKPLPMIVQGNRGYCGVAILAMAGNALGLTPGAEEMAAANGFSYGREASPDIREMFSQLAREAGVHAQRQNKLDLMLMKTSLAQGLPVIVFRWWNEERDYLHSAYSARVARGEKAELPPSNGGDRKSWPGKGSYAHASIINGHRDDKREVIFTESWGPQARNRRMRYEEMEATCYYAVFFSK